MLHMSIISCGQHLSVLSHEAYLCRISVFVHCVTLYYMCCAPVSHQCICGNNQNRMDFLNPMTITWSVVITVINILMVRTILNVCIIRSKIKCDAELLRYVHGCWWSRQFDDFWSLKLVLSLAPIFVKKKVNLISITISYGVYNLLVHTFTECFDATSIYFVWLQFIWCPRNLWG